MGIPPVPLARTGIIVDFPLPYPVFRTHYSPCPQIVRCVPGAQWRVSRTFNVEQGADAKIKVQVVSHYFQTKKLFQ